MSANPYISVDNTYWDSTRTILEGFNFTCSTINDYYNTKQCARSGPCSEVATYMPSLLFSSFVDFIIYPSEYLVDNSTAGSCSALISTNDQNWWMFGEPFFRSYNVKLNYNTTEITIYSNAKQNNSPIEGAWTSIGSTIS